MGIIRISLLYHVLSKLDSDEGGKPKTSKKNEFRFITRVDGRYKAKKQIMTLINHSIN